MDQATKNLLVRISIWQLHAATYYLKAVDEVGVGCFFPEWKKRMPYLIMKSE